MGIVTSGLQLRAFRGMEDSAGLRNCSELPEMVSPQTAVSDYRLSVCGHCNWVLKRTCSVQCTNDRWNPEESIKNPIKTIGQTYLIELNQSDLNIYVDCLPAPVKRVMVHKKSHRSIVICHCDGSHERRIQTFVSDPRLPALQQRHRMTDECSASIRNKTLVAESNIIVMMHSYACHSMFSKQY